MATDESGNAIVAWEDYRNGNGDIFAQKLDVSGNRLWAMDVRVNLDTGSANQWSVTVAADSNGNTVVAWMDNRSGDDDIYAQKLDTSRNKLWATDVRVNSDSGTARQWEPAIAIDQGGNSVIVWYDDRNGDYDIYVQKLDKNGNRLWMSEVRVNSDSELATQVAPAVAVDTNGNAVVVWDDRRYRNEGIYAQRLNVSGNRLWAVEVRVNSDNVSSE